MAVGWQRIGGMGRTGSHERDRQGGRNLTMLDHMGSMPRPMPQDSTSSSSACVDDMPLVLPDLLAPGLHVVFCGTAPGHHSARKGAYYAGPGNRFWPTLHLVGLTPRRLSPEQALELLALGLGLTDLVKHRAGSDHELAPEDYDAAALEDRLLAVAPQIVAFTSKQAARMALGLRHVAYGCSPDQRFAGAEVHVLTSPSGRATSWWDVAPWQALAERVRVLQGLGDKA